MTLVRSCCFSACRSSASATSRSSRVGYVDAGRGPQFRVHADRREPGNRVHLVDEDLVRAEQEIYARHPGAIDRLERQDREPLDFRGCSRSEIRRNDGSRSVIDVLGFVIVELARRDDLAWHRGLRRVVAEHGAFDFAGVGDRRFDDNLSIEAAGEIHRIDQSGAALRLGDADARSQVCWFDEHRIAERLLQVGRDVVALALPVVPENRSVGANRESRGCENDFHDHLIHADGGRQHAGADIRHVGKLQQTLNRAVFAVRSVQDREDHVEIQPGDDRLAFFVARGAPIDRQDRFLARARHEVHFATAAARPGSLEPRLLDHVCRRHRRRRPIRERPSPVFLDPDGHRLVAGPIQIGENRSRRRQRHFVFTGTSAV